MRLERAAQELSTVEITEDMFAHELRGFEERRKGAFGNFITEDMLLGYPKVSANQIADHVPRLRAVRTSLPPHPVLVMRRGAGYCYPLIFTDGVNNGRIGGPAAIEAERSPELWRLLDIAKRVEVYSDNHAPPRFADVEGCGAVVIWTR